MTRRPPRPVRAFASVLAAGALLITAACSGGGKDSGGTASGTATDGSASPLSDEPQAASSSATGTPAARLTQSGAKAALVTMADLEDDWQPAKGAQHWGDTLLVGKVDVADFLTGKSNAADCQKLLDALYDDDLLGKPSGASAVAGFQQGDSRLLYQVAAYQRAHLDDTLKWLGTLPSKCDQFTEVDGKGGKRTVQVTEQSVPAEGDARQALHVVVQGTSNGAPATLTLDVAAVRVGDDAITVTTGGLDGGQHDSLERAVQQGTPRLEDVLAGKTPAADPSQFD